MNENLQELANLCRSRYKENDVDLEMFAKLIVLQCIDLVEGFSIVQEVAEDRYEEINAEDVLMDFYGIKQ